jgi:uncharacterized protein
MEIRAVAVAAVIAIGQTIHAASFDCAKARRGHEALICANQELSKADDALADAYRRAHGALASIGSPKEAKRAQQRLDKEEKEWLKTRLSKCSDVECLRREYQLRLATLRSYVRGETTAAQPRENPPAVQAPLPPPGPSSQVPEGATSAKEVNPQPPSNPYPIEPQSTPPVRPGPLPEEPVTTGGNPPPSASDTAAVEGKSPESISTSKSDEHPTESGSPESGKAAPSSPGLLSAIVSDIPRIFSAVWPILLFLYVIWGAYWGCKIVYPRMMAWYKSQRWFIFGTSPMDILTSQIVFGLQVRFWAIVIGLIVGCLGGAAYMQFFRPTSRVKA